MNTGIIYLLIALALLALSALKSSEKTKKALKATGKIALIVFPVLFLVFVLMGTIQAFVPRESIAALLSSEGGSSSILIGEAIGCFALVQPAAVFPFAGFLRDSGAGYGAVVGFVMTAILIGVSTLPLELELFGKQFTLTRNLLTFICIFFLGLAFEAIL